MDRDCHSNVLHNIRPDGFVSTNREMEYIPFVDEDFFSGVLGVFRLSRLHDALRAGNEFYGSESNPDIGYLDSAIYGYGANYEAGRPVSTIENCSPTKETITGEEETRGIP
jgi:hypothetical protein